MAPPQPSLLGDSVNRSENFVRFRQALFGPGHLARFVYDKDCALDAALGLQGPIGSSHALVDIYTDGKAKIKFLGPLAVGLQTAWIDRDDLSRSPGVLAGCVTRSAKLAVSARCVIRRVKDDHDILLLLKRRERKAPLGTLQREVRRPFPSPDHAQTLQARRIRLPLDSP